MVANDAGNETFWKTSSKILPISTHLILLLLYIYPLYYCQNGKYVFDEGTVLSFNYDIAKYDRPYSNIWLDDYWGTPMASHFYSHQSWRPFTVLTIRLTNDFLKFTFGETYFDSRNNGIDPLFIHRLVNVLIHATLAELVSILACLMFPQKTVKGQTLLRLITKLLFGLHSTHVEGVANVANRVHCMSLLFGVLSIDVRLSNFCRLCVWSLGMLTCETIVFQLPAILLTMSWIQSNQRHTIYNKRKSKDDDNEDGKESIFEVVAAPWKESLLDFLQVVKNILPHILVLVISTGLFLAYRASFGGAKVHDTRKEENPFFNTSGLCRVLSYGLTFVIHIGKAIFIDPLGHSMEYGYACIDKVEDFTDKRSYLLLLLCVIFMELGFRSIAKGFRATHFYLIVLAWIATLFPLMGFITVATFVNDRMLMPMTVIFSIVAAHQVTRNIDIIKRTVFFHNSYRGRMRLVVVVYGIFHMLCSDLFHRVGLWTSNDLLVNQSWNVCPTSTKMNFGMGMNAIPERMIHFAERIMKLSPDYCKVHSLFVNAYQMLNDIPNFEKHLVQSLYCGELAPMMAPRFHEYLNMYRENPHHFNRLVDEYKKVEEDWEERKRNNPQMRKSINPYLEDLGKGTV